MKTSSAKIHYILGLAKGLRSCTTFKEAHVKEIAALIANEAQKIIESELTFVKDSSTEQTGGGVMNDQLHLTNGKLLVISEDLICLYENEEQYNTSNLPASQTICLYDIPKKEAKKDMHLLFGREVCETMAEEGIDEVCNLINDGAEYSIMKTDGSNLTAVLSELEDKGGYCFLTLDEYNKILEV